MPGYASRHITDFTQHILVALTIYYMYYDSVPPCLFRQPRLLFMIIQSFWQQRTPLSTPGTQLEMERFFPTFMPSTTYLRALAPNRSG